MQDLVVSARVEDIGEVSPVAPAGGGSLLSGRVGLRAHRVIAICVAVAAALALAACSPKTDPSPSTSTSPSESASSPPSSASASSDAILDMPELAGEHSESGAKAFARFAVELVDEGYVTAESSQFRSISDAKCRGCRILISQIQRFKNAGEHARERSLWVVRTVWAGSRGARSAVDVVGTSYEVDVMDSRGQKAYVQDGDGKVMFRLILVWRDAAWRILQYDRIIE